MQKYQPARIQRKKSWPLAAGGVESTPLGHWEFVRLKIMMELGNMNTELRTGRQS